MIVGLEDLGGIRSDHINEKIVLTSGTFDVPHPGHIDFLNAVKTLGDIVVVMLSGDNRVRARKGPSRPIIPENDRALMLDALRVVNYVFIDPATAPPDEVDPVHAVIADTLQPDVYASNGFALRFRGILEESKFVVVPRSNDSGLRSTTAIVEHIRNLPS